MSNGNATPTKGESTGQDPLGGHESSRHVDTITPGPSTNGRVLTNGSITRHHVESKSDSEAETVVLSGKEEASATTSRKTIKHEDPSGDEGDQKLRTVKSDGRIGDRLRIIERNGIPKPSLKRKRIVHEGIIAPVGFDGGGTSSNLTSTHSSPAPQAPSDKMRESDSDRSRTSPPTLEDVRKKKGRLRKRKLESTDDQDERNMRGKSDPSADIVNGKERRESRHRKPHDSPSIRSESPPARQHSRKHSNQSASNLNGVKRRRAPQSLSIDGRRKTSDSTGPDSDDSSCQRSRQRLQKSASVDEPMTSKLSHKKILDRSGRTPVARACANDNIEQLTVELKERPHHLNEPDYAKNTPLQIAALEGFVDTVRYLIREGCAINCKNIDGDTPLIDAVENGHLEVVDLLLGAGADPRLRNGKGFEPLDLVNPENDGYDELRAALVASKEAHNLRRLSEDQAAGSHDNDGASASAPGGSPTDSLQTQASKAGSGGGEVPSKSNMGKSGNPDGDIARRKTARRQATREDLLWVSSTPARLRDAASKGDMAIVVQCLNNLMKADTASMLAAARGGHDDVLDILIAMGEPEHDPDPLEPTNYKAGHNTPMLAAIGGGNIKAIKLLLSQPGFDPTRRIYRGLTYYEIARQRGGTNCQEEYEVLKEAYDNYSKEGRRTAAHSSPRKVRPKRPDSSGSTKALSMNDRYVEKVKDENARRSPSFKHLHPNDIERKGSSAILSDREAESPDPSKPKGRNGRSISDAGSRPNSRQEPGKRRRLLSKNEMQIDHDGKRRASMATDKTGSSHDKIKRISADPPASLAEDKNQAQDTHTPREGSKKRLRRSISPQGSVPAVSHIHEIAKKKKRQRVDSHGNALEQEVIEIPPRGPAMTTNMVSSPDSVTSPIKTPGTAPVAFMGGSVAPPAGGRSSVNNIAGSTNPSMGTLDSTILHDVAASQTANTCPDEITVHSPNHDNDSPTVRWEKWEAIARKLGIPVSARLSTDKETHVTAAEQRTHEEKASGEDHVTATHGKESQEKDEAVLKARQEEAELQRQLQTEREEQEARAAKKRNDELQMLLRRAEQDRQQKEKEERRRAEIEHREEQRRIRLREEQELHRREQLPYGLRRAAELSPDEARDPLFFQNWLPLYYVTTEDLDPDCASEDLCEKWITNVQVAPLLANKDLDLSQYTAWARRPLTMTQRGSLWRQLRNQQSGVRIPELIRNKSEKDLVSESKQKFFTTLDSVFWLKHSEFVDIIPRHPHLCNTSLTVRHMALLDHPFGIGGTWDDEKSEGRMSVGQNRRNGREEEDAVVPQEGPTPDVAVMTNGLLFPNGHI